MRTGQILIFIVLLGVTLQAQTWQNYDSTNSGLPGNHVHTGFIGPDGVKWFGTGQGLSQFDGASWKNYTTADGLVHNDVKDIAADISQNSYHLWIATSGGISLANVTPPAPVVFTDSYTSSTSGLLSDLVSAVALDTNLVKWFGTDQGVSVLTQSGWLGATENDYLTSNLILDITSGPAGLMHIATQGGGISRLQYDDVDGITSASTINMTWSALLSDTIYTVYIDDEDVQWYGTGEGLFRHTGLDSKINWTVFRMEEGLPDNHVQAITKDTTGTVWIGTRGGACSIKDNQISVYTTENGLISNQVNDVITDVNGDIWFATAAGVSKLTFGSTGIRKLKPPLLYQITNYPNPFNSGTILKFSVPVYGSVSISIVNLAGQKVRGFKTAAFPAGEHRIRWAGIGDHGQKLPSGVYFAVLSFAGSTLTHKLVMLQ